MTDWNFTNLANVEIKTENYQRDPFLISGKPKDGTNGVYEMNLRFLFYPMDKDLCIVQKNQVQVKNPMNPQESVFFDCPRSVGKKSIFSDLDFLLKDKAKKGVDKNIVDAIGENFKRWMACYSPVYVMSDPSHPENSGQCKVLTYGFNIKSLIDTELKGTNIKPKCQIFDFMTGKNFYYCATSKNKYGSDYSASKFFDTPSAFTFKVDNGQGQMVDYTVSNEEIQAIAQGQNTPLKNLLMTKLPDMTAYLYKEPEREKMEQAIQYLRIILSPYPQIMNELVNVTTDTEMKELLLAGGMPQQPQQFGQSQPQPQQFVQTQQQQQVQQPQNTFSAFANMSSQQNVAQQPQQMQAQQTFANFGGGSFVPPQQNVQQTVEPSEEQKNAFENLINNL